MIPVPDKLLSLPAPQVLMVATATARVVYSPFVLHVQSLLKLFFSIYYNAFNFL